MSISAQDCCILNEGNGSWAFEPLAQKLSFSLGVEIATTPRAFNYLLHIEDVSQPFAFPTFISVHSVKLASDKRSLAHVFSEHGVPTPKTEVLDSFSEVLEFVQNHSEAEWCLKYPTSCGGHGHRLITNKCSAPANWPKPFVVQEFIRLERPQVFRTFCAENKIFGWVVRQYPEGTEELPWVAHARGARYANLYDPPEEACAVARKALVATGLLDSFGCVDLIQGHDGSWLVLEVGTDGLFNHVDRDVGDEKFEQEMQQRITKAFWNSANKYEN